ncbi:hypothetical protein BDV93DRAFT_525803 [Ceratobasidium sp. AG-I]|nr:hypothetical protein BDV93DRAFT_525803 [Ceratobasidium sp. AG-I]
MQSARVLPCLDAFVLGLALCDPRRDCAVEDIESIVTGPLALLPIREPSPCPISLELYPHPFTH